VQEVLIRSHARWSRISAMDQPEAYLKRMILNQFLSLRRRRAARVTPSRGADPGALPGDVGSGRVGGAGPPGHSAGPGDPGIQVVRWGIAEFGAGSPAELHGPLQMELAFGGAGTSITPV
jgi:hypothetical protein